jgi:hypothetical protein
MKEREQRQLFARATRAIAPRVSRASAAYFCPDVPFLFSPLFLLKCSENLKKRNTGKVELML